jgi:uncharacterized membrane protein YdjX (TVP38/TMEM64 family)
MLTSVVVILLFLVFLVLDFSIALDVFDNEEDLLTTMLASSIVWTAADFFYGLYALVLAFALGRFCYCCECCCDDEDECVYD